MGIKKVKVEYCGDNYELFCSTNDDRTNLVSGRKGTQEGKVCTWKEIVTKLKSQRVFDVGSNYGEFLNLPLMLAKTLFSLGKFELWILINFFTVYLVLKSKY